MSRLLLILLLLTMQTPVLTLEEAAQSALREHPQLRVSQADVLVAEARRDRATAPYYPTLNATMGYDTSESVGNTGGLNVVRVGNNTNYSIGLALRQLVFDFGRRSNNLRAAELGLEATESDLLDTRQDLLLNVVDAYFTVLREAENVEIREENVANARARLQQAEGFYEVGVRARIEVTQARAELARAELGLIQARNAELRARTTLASTMGVPGPIAQPLASTSLPDPGLAVEAAYTRATELRPDVRAIQARVEAARHTLKATEAEYYPEITTGGNYNLSDEVFFPLARRWNWGVDLAVPLFNEPTLSANVAEAEAQIARLLAQQDVLLLQVRTQVTEAVLALGEARESLRAAEVASENARENFRLASERYTVGVGSALEVSDAQRLLVEAESQEAQARLDLERATARVYRSTGTLDLGLMRGQRETETTP